MNTALKLYPKSSENYFSRKAWALSGICVSLILFATVAVAQNPVVTVRFANPQFDCAAGTYRLDVEFQSNIPNQQLFGMNVRFYYDDAVLEFDSFSAFQNGYGPVPPNPPTLTTASPASGPAMFGLAGAAEYVNGAVQLINPSAAPLYLAMTGWTKLFTACFKVVDPAASGTSFCPPVIWDLKSDPTAGGFLPGSNGVVITLVSPPPAESAAADEQALQFNWRYTDAVGMPYGYPAAEMCVEPKC